MLTKNKAKKVNEKNKNCTSAVAGSLVFISVSCCNCASSAPSGSDERAHVGGIYLADCVGVYTCHKEEGKKVGKEKRKKKRKRQVDKRKGTGI